MIKIKDLASSRDVCFGCRTNTHEGQDVYCVSLCALNQGEECTKVAYTATAYSNNILKLKINFCKSCWIEMAGEAFSFEENETVCAPGTTTRNSGVQGVWAYGHNTTYRSAPPLGSMIPPPQLYPDLKTDIWREKVKQEAILNEFDKTDAIICAGIASILMVVGFVFFKLGAYFYSL